MAHSFVIDPCLLAKMDQNAGPAGRVPGKTYPAIIGGKVRELDGVALTPHRHLVARHPLATTQSTDRPMKTLNIAFAGDDLPELRTILNRAMNTLEPRAYPEWLQPLSDKLDEVLANEAVQP